MLIRWTSIHLKPALNQIKLSFDVQKPDGIRFKLNKQTLIHLKPELNQFKHYKFHINELFNHLN